MSKLPLLSYVLLVVAGTLRAEANTGSPIRQTDPSQKRPTPLPRGTLRGNFPTRPPLRSGGRAMYSSATRLKIRALRISAPCHRTSRRRPPLRRNVSPLLGGTDEDSRPPPAQRVNFVLPELGSPFASKPNVVAYDRHVLFATDDPADAARACERVRAPPRVGK